MVEGCRLTAAWRDSAKRYECKFVLLNHSWQARLRSYNKIMNTPTAVSFSEYYKTITDWELVTILENPEDYQQEAIEAAEQELKRRQLSLVKVEEIKNRIAQEQLRKIEARQKREAVERTIREKVLIALESLNPIQEELTGAEKVIRFIVIFWGLLTLYQGIHDWRIEWNALKAFPVHPFLNSIILFPFIILPVSIYHLWKRKSLGWTLFVIYLTFQLLAEISMLLYAITWKPSGIEWMDQLVRPSFPKTVLRLLFVAGTFYSMCRLNVRALLFIERKKMFVTIGATVVVAMFVFLGLMNQ